MNEKSWEEQENLLNYLQNDILVTNVDGEILKVSEATGGVYQTDAEALIGKSVYDLEKEGMFTPLATPMVIEKKEKVTFIQMTKDDRKLLVTAIPIFDDDGELTRIVSYSHDVTELIEMKQYLETMEDEMARTKKELESLKEKQVYGEGIIAYSEKMRKVMKLSEQVADVDVNILIQGETGVGKSHLARYIHSKSSRSKGPFIEVNCGSIPDALFESEFFGYESGAFTGADRNGKKGMVELAEGGTLFLDETGELSSANQVKVLKLIQEKQFYRVGGRQLKKVNFRLIAATNRDLDTEIEQGNFRRDLYFRLNVVPIALPPLRERQEDILPLLDHFLERFNQKYGFNKSFDAGVKYKLLSHPWKGNVRELANLVERLTVTSSERVITIEMLPSSNQYNFGGGETLQEVLENVERAALLEAFRHFKTTTGVAKALGISQPTAVRKLKKYHIT
ncbi:sigma-54 interaction domain-containing protein [Falsibacillus albus]|uniref:HTH-type transcriptional regulatory protein TyrR n=1 Tax=Falsibacillus albus TaxID=2478915 RepID=A0A3L7JSG7_9BACI|nr:sigma 54-interacting transcriptional regulator [Falsibacillus albus]RLQ93798.1 PAS domain-containing protein [Falsibacillus albus]